MGTPGPLELIIIFAVVLLLFGAKRIPEIARGIGKGIREFKDATNEISRELEAEGKNRQINQPKAPQQGAPQAREPQQTTSSQQAPPEETTANSSGSEAGAPQSNSDEKTKEAS